MLVLKGITLVDLLTRSKARRNLLARIGGARDRIGVDHPRRRGHRFQPAPGAHRAADRADRGVGSGHCALPGLAAGLHQSGGGVNTGSILLMLLGTQWYILFNVIAGAIAIPSEFREVADIFPFSRLDRWRTVNLPAIFPT